MYSVAAKRIQSVFHSLSLVSSRSSLRGMEWQWERCGYIREAKDAGDILSRKERGTARSFFSKATLLFYVKQEFGAQDEKMVRGSRLDRQRFINRVARSSLGLFFFPFSSRGETGGALREKDGEKPEALYCVARRRDIVEERQMTKCFRIVCNHEVYEFFQKG